MVQKMKNNKFLLMILSAFVILAGFMAGNVSAANFGSSSTYGGCNDADPMACMSLDFLLSGGNARFWTLLGFIILTYFLFYGIIEKVELFSKESNIEKGIAMGMALILFAVPQVRIMMLNLGIIGMLMLFGLGITILVISFVYKGGKNIIDAKKEFRTADHEFKLEDRENLAIEKEMKKIYDNKKKTENEAAKKEVLINQLKSKVNNTKTEIQKIRYAINNAQQNSPNYSENQKKLFNLKADLNNFIEQLRRLDIELEDDLKQDQKYFEIIEKLKNELVEKENIFIEKVNKIETNIIEKGRTAKEKTEEKDKKITKFKEKIKEFYDNNKLSEEMKDTLHLFTRGAKDIIENKEKDYKTKTKELETIKTDTIKSGKNNKFMRNVITKSFNVFLEILKLKTEEEKQKKEVEEMTIEMDELKRKLEVEKEKINALINTTN